MRRLAVGTRRPGGTELVERMGLEDQLKKAGFVRSAASEQSPEPLSARQVRFAPKVVVRWGKLETGGKAVTSVVGVTEGRDQVADALKKLLGTSARVVGEAIVMQGDHVERAAAWLEAKGAKKVVQSH